MSFNDMAKTHPLSFRVEPEVKEGLEKAAKADRRSLSSLIEKILAEWLQERAEQIPIRGRKPDAPTGGGEPEGSTTAGDSASQKRGSPARRPKAASLTKEAQLRALREQGNAGIDVWQGQTSRR
jgi:hypothetical protein